MSDTNDTVLMQWVDHVSGRLASGQREDEIRRTLAGRLPQDYLGVVFQAVRRQKRRRSRRAGLIMVLIGAAALAGGAVITFGTYAAARPGGTYVAMTGLLGIGVVFLGIGLLRAATGWNFDINLPEWAEPVGKGVAIVIVMLIVWWLSTKR